MRPFASPPPPRVNVTPLIDVMMCLIVFYLIVGRLASMQRPEVALPESAAGLAARHEDAIVLTLTPDGRARIDGVDAPLETLAPILHRALQARPDAPIEIRADQALEFGEVSGLIDACRIAGAASIRLAVRDGARP